MRNIKLEKQEIEWWFPGDEEWGKQGLKLQLYKMNEF